MSIIDVSAVSKVYRTKLKEEGVKASVKSFFNPVYQEVNAVSEVSFTVEEGEAIAFIGPNGAGKSTTIKMLTGILHPSSGQIQVLGYNPLKDRQRLAMHIGSVFGQRSQLWMHLPPTDSFSLIAQIYEVDDTVYRKRLSELVNLFDIQDLMPIAVRKLSLGQRIRCEIVASLLHNPRVLFLDEPTIGLDVIAKQRIRELIHYLNQENKTTIFLTSHDAGDVEHLCERALIIDKGSIVVDDSIASLKHSYFQRKIIELSFTDNLLCPSYEGVSMEIVSANRMRLTVDTTKCAIGSLLQNLVASGEIRDVTINDPPMEEIIATIYRRGLGEEHV